MFAKIKNFGVFQINKMPGRFRLGEIKDKLKVRYAHLFISEYEMKDTDPGFVAYRLENLGGFLDFKVLDFNQRHKGYIFA